MLRFITAGESHGKGLVVVIEGIPAGFPFDAAAINSDLKRRQGGYGRGGRMKIESDQIDVISGVRQGLTTGAPVSFFIQNKDWANWQDVMSVEANPEGAARRQVTRPRPGHADLAGALKYNLPDIRDVLERASARETTARVAVGGFCRLLLSQFDIQVFSHTISIKGVAISEQTLLEVGWSDVARIEQSPLRCADSEAEKQMIEAIDTATREGDSVGGSFEVRAMNVPPGLGSYAQWDRKLDGQLAQAVMSINAIKGVEIGTGIRKADLGGSKFHDEIFFDPETRRFTRGSNRAGGLEGGVTNGMEVIVRGHVKPIPTLRKPLQSVDVKSKEAFQAAYERSDVCVVPAAGVIGEAMVAIVLARAFLEKFGGDSLTEISRNFNSYQEQLRNYFSEETPAKS